MGRSSSSLRVAWVVLLDRAALGGIGVGLVLYFMPFWRDGRLGWALWLTLLSSLLHVYTSHARGAGKPTREEP